MVFHRGACPEPSAAAPGASPPPTRAACRPATRRGACRRPGRRRLSPPGRRKGAAHDLAEPHSHEPGRARAHPAGPRALPGRPARARVLDVARPDVLLGLGAPEQAHGLAREGAAAGPAGPPLRPVPVMPLAHETRPAAPGARVRLPARPAEPVGHLRAQRPREPPPLAVRPAPSPLAVSCQASRVSLRHVFSLTTSWRRRGASSCRRWSNRELGIDDTLVELLRVGWTNLYGSLDCKRRRDRLL